MSKQKTMSNSGKCKQEKGMDPSSIKTENMTDSADKLGDEDRETIIKIARHALGEFSPEPDSKSEPEQESF